MMFTEKRIISQAGILVRVVAAVLIGIAGCGLRAIRQVEHVVHLGSGQRDRRRIEPHVAVAMPCTSARALPGLVSRCRTAIGVGVEDRVVVDLLVGGQADDGAVARRALSVESARRARMVRIVQGLAARPRWNAASPQSRGICCALRCRIRALQSALALASPSPCAARMAYGSIAALSVPGVSTVVESIWSSCRAHGAATNAVPRRSVI